MLGEFDWHWCMLKSLESYYAVVFKTIGADWVSGASSRSWCQNRRFILECVNKQDIFNLRWLPLRSSGFILSRKITRRPLRSSVVLGGEPLSRGIVWLPLRSRSILKSWLVLVIQIGFLAPCKINRSQPFIRLFRDNIGGIKVGPEAIKYDKLQPFGGGFALSWVDRLEEVVIKNVELGTHAICVEVPD